MKTLEQMQREGMEAFERAEQLVKERVEMACRQLQDSECLKNKGMTQCDSNDPLPNFSVVFRAKEHFFAREDRKEALVSVRGDNVELIFYGGPTGEGGVSCSETVKISEFNSFEDVVSHVETRLVELVQQYRGY